MLLFDRDTPQWGKCGLKNMVGGEMTGSTDFSQYVNVQRHDLEPSSLKRLCSIDFFT